MRGVRASRNSASSRRAAVLFSLLASVFAAAAPAGAQQTLSFNDATPDPTNSILGEVNCSAGGTGFRFVSGHFHLLGVGGATFQAYSTNGTNAIGYESGRGFPIDMQRVGAGTFALLAVDAAEFYAVPDPDRPNANFLTITGTQQGGAVVTHTVALDGVHDGQGGVQDYEHFTLPNTFVNLVSVTFTGTQTNGNPGGVSVDNIVYQLASPQTLPTCVPVPLPPETPAVTITSPSAGNVSGTVTIAATATDNSGIARVQFRVDGVAVGAADTSAPYAVQWDSTTVSDGTHTLTADATAVDGDVQTGSVVVTVRNDTSPNQNPHYVDFDGTNDYARVSDADALSFGNGAADTPLTIEAWIHPDSMAGKQQILGKWGETSSQGYEYKLYIASGVLRMDLRDTSADALMSVYTGNQSALAGGWHHVAVTYDGRGGSTAASGITIYVDGAAVPVTRANNAAYVAMENVTAPLQFGRESNGWQMYAGGLDEVRLWNVARAQGAIQASMTTELTGSEPGLVGYWRFNEGSGTGAQDSASGAYPATLFNGTAWVAGGPMGSAEPDTTAPVIGSIAVSNVTSTSATIAFTTDEPTTARVAFTTGLSCPPCTEVLSAATGTAHMVTLSGLTAATTYRFEVRASDAANNQAVSSPLIAFTTPAPPADTTAPTVTMVQPLGGTVSGVVTIQANATDNVGVVSVQFKLDGANLGSPDTAAPYQISWNSALVANGSHTIQAEARDAANNVATSTLVVVNVSNGGGGTPTSPFYLDFDGADDYARVADADALSFGNGTADMPLTIEAWIRPDSTAGKQQLLGKWGESSGQGYEYKLYLASGVIRFDIRDNSANALVSVYTGNQAALAGAWHHVAVTYDGRGGAAAANGITIYLDGVAAAVTRTNNAAYVAMENLTVPLQLGRESNGFQMYGGGLDDLRLWNVARTQGAIQAAMSSELAGSEPGLVGYWRFNEGSGATAADSSAAGRSMTLSNGPAWLAGGPMGPAAPDTTPPTISNITASNLTSTGVTITFTTSEATTARVAYTTGVACPCTEVASPVTGTSHMVVLSGLTAATTYRFEVRAADAANNQAVSSPLIAFTTPAPPTDTTAPTVTMVQPLGGTVSGVVTIQANASDNVGVVSVQFRLDGANLGSPDTAAPYQISWNSALVGNGSHTIQAEARDAANNVATSTLVVVNVSNGGGTPTSPFYLDFDGTDDYARVADADALSFGNGTADAPLTIETWMRPDSMTGKQQLLGKWGESAGQGYEYKLYLASGVIRFDIRDNSANALVSVYTGNQAALAGAWHHVAVTYDGRGGATAANGITIYVDGVAAAVTRVNNAAYVAMENLTVPLQLGRESNGFQMYNGGLDELRLWNVARTQGAIQATMSSQLAGSEPGLVGYWRLNEGTGATAADSSPGGRSMTLSNGPAWVAGGPLP